MNGERVTITYLMLMISWPILNRLLAEPLLPKGAYALGRNVNALFPFFKEMYDKQQELVKKHGTFAAEKQQWIVDKDTPELVSEYNLFKAQTFETTLMKIELKNLIAPITAQEMDAISFLICEDKILLEMGSTLLQ